MKKRNIMNTSLRLAALCVAALLCAGLTCGSALAGIPPLPKSNDSYVFDFATDGVMRAQDIAAMDAAAETLEQKTGAQVVAVVVDFLDGEQIDLYAHDLFTQWGIGQRKENNGALVLFSRGEREISIYAGTGLEHTLSGAARGQILDDIIPTLKDGDYSAGIREAFLAACERVARSYGIKLPAAQSGGWLNNAWQGNNYSAQSGNHSGQREEGTNWFGTLIAVLVVWFVIKNAFRPRYAANRRGGCLPFLLGGFLGNMMRGPFGGPHGGPFGGSHGMPPMGGWGNFGNFRGGGFGGFGGNGGGGFKPGGGTGRGGSSSRKF